MTEHSSAIAQSREPLPGSLRHHRDFRLFWLGETVSLFGTQVTALALPLTAIHTLDATDEQVGLLRFLQLAPFLFLAVFVGVYVDRVRRRPVLLAANAVRLALLLLIPFLHWQGQLTLLLLLVIAVAVGVASVFFDVTWMSYVPTLVRDARHYVEASSKLSVSSSAADIAGPGVGGALLSVFAAPVVLLVDAASYAISLLALCLIRVQERAPESQARRHVPSELREGIGLVLGDPVLKALALIGACCNFAMVSTWTMFLLYAARDLDLASGVIGAVFAMASVGGLLGAAASGRLLRSFRLGTVYTVAQTVLLLGPWLLVAAGPSNVALATALATASFFLTYLGLGVAGVVIVSLRQARTPATLMARMTAVFRTLLFGGGALGGLTAGLLVGQVGGRTALGMVAGFSTLVVAAVWCSPVRPVRELPVAVR